MADVTQITLTVDDREVVVPAGTSVVDAANSVGIEVPIFCHHPRLEPVGMCRMCLVEVGTPAVDRATGQVQLDDAGAPVIRFFPKLQAGCTMPVSAGMVVRTATAEVADARRSVLEFLLTSHPLDCPVCDKGGECPLQNLTLRYGPGASRFPWAEKYRFPKPVPLGPLIALDRERCVLCARCIRFEDEIAGDQVLGFENRGRGMEIVSFSDPPFDSKFSGNTSDVCPVGALTTKDFRFESRVWELQPRPAICGHCPVGCNLTYDERYGRILRAMPRQNDAVNEIWLCDKGRFAHHHAASPERLATPLVRRDGALVPATWEEALGVVAERLRGVIDAHGPAAVGGIAGDGLCNEDLYLFGRFLRAVVGTNNVDHAPGIIDDDLVARVGAGPATRLTELGPGTTIVVAGLDVEEEAPVLYLNLFKAIRRGAKVVVVSGRPQKLDPHAASVLRYRYRADEAGGGEVDVVTALLAESLARRDVLGDAALSALKADLAEAGAGLAGLAGHPIHDVLMDAAVTAVAEAEHLLVLYGQEARGLGMLPALAALAASTGRAGQTDDGLIAVGRHANAQGAADMGVRPGWLPGYRPVGAPDAGGDLVAAGWPTEPPATAGLGAAEMLAGGVRALLVVGADPAGDEERAEEALEGLEFLVVQELFLTRTARRAHVVLPAQSLPERDGTLTNLLRRVQRTYAAARPVGQALPDWRILALMAVRMGVAEAFDSAADVFEEIARAVPQYAGLSYAALGAAQPTEPTDRLLPFAPILDARHVEYEGTSYANAFGLGMAWPVAKPDAAAPATSADVPAAPDDTSDAAGAQGDTIDAAAAEGDPGDGAGSAAARAHDASDHVLAMERLAPVLAWRPAARRAPAPPADDDALTLVTAARLYDAGTVLAHSAVLSPLIPEPYVELSPFDALPRRIADGARIRLVGGRGAVTADVRVRDGVTPGTVVAPLGLAWETPLAVLLDGHATAVVRLEPVG